jgi:NADH dehydrogenase
VNSSGRIVVVIGGSGFVGRHVVQALARSGYRVRVAVRRPDLAYHLQPLGFPGQIMPVQVNLRFPDSLERASASAFAVINMVGILHESGPQTFAAVHVNGAGAAARAARNAGAERFIQVSAIGADPQSRSAYARSKAEGEAAVAGAFPGATIIRPAIVFGPEDDFFNRFAAMAVWSPALPLIGGGRTRFEPVYAGDVGEAVVRLLERRDTTGQIFELGGPEILTFRQLMAFVLRTIGRRRLLLSMPWWLAYTQAAVLGLMPKPLLTLDQVRMLRRDTVVSEAARRDRRTLDGLGITPEGIETLVPAYLYRYRRSGQYAEPRAE